MDAGTSGKGISVDVITVNSPATGNEIAVDATLLGTGIAADAGNLGSGLLLMPAP